MWKLTGRGGWNSEGN
ncbi:hypothetical protein LINPERPRIM_LOCUS32917 [Linum perenne]